MVYVDVKLRLRVLRGFTPTLPFVCKDTAALHTQPNFCTDPQMIILSRWSSCCGTSKMCVVCGCVSPRLLPWLSTAWHACHCSLQFWSAHWSSLEMMKQCTLARRTSAMLRRVLATVGLPRDPTAMSASTFRFSTRTWTVARSMPTLDTNVLQGGLRGGGGVQGRRHSHQANEGLKEIRLTGHHFSLHSTWKHADGFQDPSTSLHAS